MATTPRGFVQVANTDPLATPADINRSELFLEGLISESVATSAELPASGNKVGRTITAEDTGVLYLCTALPGTWKRVWAIDDTGWQSPELNTGWSNESGNPMQFRRINGQIFNRGRGSSAGANPSPFTYPAGFLPDVPSGAANVFLCDGTGPQRVSIPSTGVIAQLPGAAAVTNLSLTNVTFRTAS